ncbi:unnamed protein product [Haemonchus placei]|uniref:Protein kinase domain-containing protein n=1 Tax=Haemonchus placei TaxID=6290 RepID=A0A0N4X424_HAEPC|nr:unnamed protein product [Haemonchus placei]
MVLSILVGSTEALVFDSRSCLSQSYQDFLCVIPVEGWRLTCPFLYCGKVHCERESQESERVWTKAETTKQPFVTLFNLKHEEAYLFRIRADNTLGQSEPSEESDVIYVKGVSRAVEEPKKKAGHEESEAINYDRLDTNVDLSKHKPIDVNRLPNDLQAKYIICEELGQGAYGTVYRAIEKATGKTWAAKMVQSFQNAAKDG